MTSVIWADFIRDELVVVADPVGPLGYRERSHPERRVEEAAYWRLVGEFGLQAVVRQFHGWRRPDGGRAGLIPDFLVVSGSPWSAVLVVEVKAKPATPAGIRQLRRYMDRALAMPGVSMVAGVIASPGCSTPLPSDIKHWNVRLVAS